MSFEINLGFSLIGAVVVVLVTAGMRASLRLIHDADIRMKSFPLEGYQGDAMTHLLMVDLIRRNGGRIPDVTKQFLLNHPNDYPMFFHKIHAWLPRRVLEQFEWAVQPLYEGIHLGLLFVVTVYLFDHVFQWSDGQWTAYLVAFGVAVTPLLYTNPARFAAFGERTFAFFSANTYLVAAVLYAATSSLVWGGVAVLFFAVTSVSSKFGLQAIVFISMALSLLRFDLLPVALLLVSFLASVLLSNRYCLTVIKGLLRHSRVYYSWLMHVQDYVKSISLQRVWDGAKLAARGQIREAIGVVQQHPLGNLPRLVPWFFLFIPMLVTSRTWWPAEPHASLLMGWLVDLALASCLVTALIMLDPLKFLGEAERYLEYALFPMLLTVTIAVYVKESSWWAGYAAVFIFCVGILISRTSCRELASRGDTEMGEVVSFLHKLSPTRFIGIPGRLAFPICYATDHVAFWLLANVPTSPRLEVFKRLFGEGEQATYPFVDPKVLRELPERHGVELIVAWKQAITGARQAFGLDYDFSDMAVLFENHGYLVFQASGRGDTNSLR